MTISFKGLCRYLKLKLSLVNLLILNVSDLVFVLNRVDLNFFRFSMELQCKVQNYDWGKLGEHSVVAKLLASAHPNTEIDPTKPYAELWMGTHPNGPSLIIERNVLLSEYIKDNLDALGPAVRKQFDVSVPFLLKVLSIRKALSIQAHPNKVSVINFKKIYVRHSLKISIEIAY